MLTKEEIELLELYKEQIEDGAKKKKSKKVDKPSGTRLFKSFAIVSTRVGSAYKLKKLLHRKSEEVLAWCVATAGNNFELPIQLDNDTVVTVNVDVDDESNSVRQVLELQLNGEGFLRLEYDSKGKFVRQHNFGSPHKGKCSMQILDSKEFRQASFKNIIADLEQKYNVDIRILTSAKDETFCYAVITGSDDSKCSAITTKEYPSIERLLEELKDVILPEYEKLADSFVKLNSLTHEAKIL